MPTGEPRQMDWLGKPAKTPDAADATRSTPRWLGLIADHRRLFDALQDGWLRPRTPNAGLLTRVGAYAEDPDVARSGHLIPVRIKLDAGKLPELDVSVLRGSQWIHSPLAVTESSDVAVYWPGPLPVFAISELAVEKEEERARLEGMARQFSNVELPGVPVTVQVIPESASVVVGSVPPIPSASNTPRLDIPAEVDPLHGAMSMAVWAVPRIDPWLDLLVASLSSDYQRLPELTAGVDAGWWRFPPWTSPADNAQPRDFQDRLWLAAVNVLRRRSIDGRAPPRALAEQIADGAVRSGSSSDKASASDWLRTTHGILRAESVIEIDGWRACPVGMAVQLILTRPEPIRFKTWHQDLPSLPPAVWWSAAVLCGLHHGYRKLDIRFRGTVEQRAFIAVHALRACAEAGIRWPALSGKPRWRRAADGFELLWGDRTIAHKPDKTHGKWYAASFDDAKVRDSAMRVAKDLGWSCCWSRRLDLPKGSRMPFAGSMTIRDEESHGREPAATRPPAALSDMPRTLTGEVYVQEPTAIELPPGHTIEEVFDIESFRRQVSVTGARLPEPPQAGVPGRAMERLRVAEVPGPGHVYPRQSHAPLPATLDIAEVPGLRYVRDFLDEADEKSIISEIDRGDWIKDLRRRVQHYGWRYDYKTRRVDPAMRLGALPAWADALARRLFDASLVPNLPDQVIVNEYVKDQGIGKHVDSGSFANGIAMISLLESWEMIFCEKRGKRKVNCMLERRSVAVIEGKARYDWTHEIPKRKSEPVEPGTKHPRRDRGRRVSLTFRKVIVGAQ